MKNSTAGRTGNRRLSFSFCSFCHCLFFCLLSLPFLLSLLYDLTFYLFCLYCLSYRFVIFFFISFFRFLSAYISLSFVFIIYPSFFLFNISVPPFSLYCSRFLNNTMRLKYPHPPLVYFYCSCF